MNAARDVYRWDHGVLSRWLAHGAIESVDCPVCGSQPARPWTRQGEWKVVACGRCGLRMTWPRPSRDFLEQAYASRDYYAARAMDDGVFTHANARAVDLAETVGRPVRRVLDFGAGEGHLVAAFRSLGLVADGVEPSMAGRKQACSRYGIELGYVLPPATDERYDLIVLQHALEHVTDPVTVLRELAERLDPFGSMLIDVPNASSIEMLRPSRRRSILDLPVHLYHFTPHTLSAVLAAAGLEAVRVSLTNPDWLEWLFAFRTVRGPDGGEIEDSPQYDVRPRSTPDRPSLRLAWRERVLPAIRRWSPGWRFGVLARRA
jgi:2-polyprenyl-3-methyl-5-hydroxy-6-metoxy-1,4-benzoquinol methylase